MTPVDHAWEDELRSRAGLVAAAGLLALLFGASILPRPAAAASHNDDISGTWVCCGPGGASPQNFLITTGSGSLAGTGVLPSGGTYASITGSESGDAVTIVTTYNNFSPGYVATFTGTISGDGNTMSGTWVSNSNQSGTWTATRSGQTSPAGGAIPSPIDNGLPSGAIAAIVIAVLAALAGTTLLLTGGLPEWLTRAFSPPEGGSSGAAGGGPDPEPERGSSGAAGGGPDS